MHVQVILRPPEDLIRLSTGRAFINFPPVVPLVLQHIHNLLLKAEVHFGCQISVFEMAIDARKPGKPDFALHTGPNRL